MRLQVTSVATAVPRPLADGRGGGVIAIPSKGDGAGRIVRTADALRGGANRETGVVRSCFGRCKAKWSESERILRLRRVQGTPL